MKANWFRLHRWLTGVNMIMKVTETPLGHLWSQNHRWPTWRHFHHFWFFSWRRFHHFFWILPSCRSPVSHPVGRWGEGPQWSINPPHLPRVTDRVNRATDMVNRVTDRCLFGLHRDRQVLVTCWSPSTPGYRVLGTVYWYFNWPLRTPPPPHSG